MILFARSCENCNFSVSFASRSANFSAFRACFSSRFSCALACFSSRLESDSLSDSLSESANAIRNGELGYFHQLK